MTVIICDRTALAGDSQATSSYGMTTCSKIFRLKKGEIVGISGILVDGLLFIEWLKDGAEGKAPSMRSVEALMLRNNTIWNYDSCSFAMRVGDKVAAIGSGAQFALGAYNAGASLKESVRIACRLDPCSGGKTRCLYPK